MDITRSRRILLVIIAAAALLLLLVTAVPGIVPAVAGGTPKSPCPVSAPHYYAYDATPGSNRFGPEQTDHSLTHLQKRFNLKLNCDPLFAATLASFEVQNVNIDPATVESTADRIAGNKKAWSDLVKGIKDDVVSYSVDNVNANYETLAMVPGSKRTVRPSLIKVDRPVTLGYTLTLHLKDGSTRYLRVSCDLQPSAPHFPKMPRHPRKPVCTVNCVPTHHKCTLKSPGIGYKVVNCHLVKPKQTKQCMLNGGPNCPPNGGHQPVQNNPCGCTGPTVNGSTPPSPLPTGPTPQDGTSAPPPNSSGYDSGSGDGSGTPQGSTCNNGTCEGGGPSSPSPGPTDGSNSGDNNTGGSNNPPPPG